MHRNPPRTGYDKNFTGLPLSPAQPGEGSEADGPAPDYGGSGHRVNRYRPPDPLGRIRTQNSVEERTSFAWLVEYREWK